MTKIAIFYLENFNFNFFKKNFETLSPKPHPLTLNSKSRLVNPRIKTHFYFLIKLILVIFFIDGYFCDKKNKNYPREFLFINLHKILYIYIYIYFYRV